MRTINPIHYFISKNYRIKVHEIYGAKVYLGFAGHVMGLCFIGFLAWIFLFFMYQVIPK